MLTQPFTLAGLPVSVNILMWLKMTGKGLFINCTDNAVLLLLIPRIK
jgi:hypothetical protein